MLTQYPISSEDLEKAMYQVARAKRMIEAALHEGIQEEVVKLAREEERSLALQAACAQIEYALTMLGEVVQKYYR